MKNFIRICILLAVVFAAIFAVVSQTAASTPIPASVSVFLNLDKSAYLTSDAVLLSVTIQNKGETPVQLLKWHTPVDGVQEPMFTVMRDGVAVKYIDRLYKRLPPTSADYITLQPGESLIREVDLAGSYDFSVTGNYSIRFDTASWNLFTEDPTYRPEMMDRLSSNEVIINVVGRPVPIRKPILVTEVVTGSTTFNQCSTTKQTSLVSARAQASIYSNQANDYLQTGIQGSLDRTWFGIYNSTRYATARNHFSAIKNAMDTASVLFDCTCTSNYYAYVYPNEPYDIYLCNVFWSAPLTGTDSKAGTLIHEMSHFYVVASTSDYVYGQTGAMQLAITNPSQAVMNADNHEYFAEDSAPVLVTPTSSRTSTPVFTATKTSTPLFEPTNTYTPTSTSTPTKTSQPNSVILVNPVLKPTPGLVCATGWYTVALGGYNNSNLYLTLNVRSALDSYNSGRWTPNILKAGRYKIEAYIGHHNSIRFSCPSVTVSQNATDARYRIRYSGGITTVVVDQSIFDGAWANLGEYAFAAGNSGFVTLTDVTRDANLSRLVAFNVLRFTWVGQ
jgi:peptidyl-Lys metalloendopeptidase